MAGGIERSDDVELRRFEEGRLMTGWRWSGNSPLSISDQLLARLESLKDRAVAEMGVLANRAEEFGKETLDDPESYTKTGIKRVASGKGEFAGRHVSGDMIDDFESELELDDDGQMLTITAKYGWPNPEDYYLFQDSGTDTVPAAHALYNAHLEVRDLFRALVYEMERGERL